MNVTFHAVASFGISHLAARNLASGSPDSIDPFDRRDTPVLITAFVAALLSHGVLDGLKHGYPIHYAIDPPLALLLAVAWCAIVKRRFRILIVTVFIGAVLPDLVDLGPAIANRLLGWHLPTFWPHLFPWHRVDGSGSLYSLEGAPRRPGHGDLDAGDNRVVSATNHAIILFMSIAAIVSNRAPFRRASTPIARVTLIVAALLALPFENGARAQEAPLPPTIGPEPIPAAPPPPAPAPPPLVTTPVAKAPSDSTDASETPSNPEPAPPLPRDPRFGDPGQVVLDGALSAGFTHFSYTATSTAGTSFNVSPALDYFSKPNVSSGVSVVLGYSDGNSGNGFETQVWTYGIEGEVGVNFWLAERVSFWPKLGLSGARITTTNTSPSVMDPTTTTTTTSKNNVVAVVLDTPFLFHVAEHFFVGFGPRAFADILNAPGGMTNLRRVWGLTSTVGGWF